MFKLRGSTQPERLQPVAEDSTALSNPPTASRKVCSAGRLTLIAIRVGIPMADGPQADQCTQLGYLDVILALLAHRSTVRTIFRFTYMYGARFRFSIDMMVFF